MDGIFADLRASARAAEREGASRVPANLRAFRARQRLRRALCAPRASPARAQLRDGRSVRALTVELLNDVTRAERTYDEERALLLLSTLASAKSAAQLVRAALPRLVDAAGGLVTRATARRSSNVAHALLELCASALQAVGDGGVDAGRDEFAPRNAQGSAASCAELHNACARALAPLGGACSPLQCGARAAFGNFLKLYGTLPELELEASATVVLSAAAWSRARRSAHADAHADVGDEAHAWPPSGAGLVGDRAVLLAAARALVRASVVLRHASTPGVSAASADAPDAAAARALDALRLCRRLALELARVSGAHDHEALAPAVADSLVGGALELCIGDDAALLDLLRCALPLSAAMPQLALSAASPAAEATGLAHALCPFRLFARASAMIGSDAGVLVDWLVAPETGAQCAAYLIALCRAAGAACPSPCGAQPARAPAEETRAEGERLLDFLRRLLDEVRRRDVAHAFGYSAAPLVRRLGHAVSLDWHSLLCVSVSH
ncbi:hypothetical protein KFE25_009848 [Diacronema lutheri]|uniref:Uncharacterized protein n=1 Tax=Diacronema lutheri TaxID=2081491 RepID=A0A8J6C6U3_DIALT|nr:hypothetical protein KFE25_009848 [Diacronema lutheri]